jgi:O-acetylhomoserine (thiol)-lyase
MKPYRIETTCVQGGYTPKNGEPRQIPIVQSTTFKYDTGEDMASCSSWSRGIFIPAAKTPQRLCAAKIAALEGGTAAMLTSSAGGQLFRHVQLSPAIMRWLLQHLRRHST